jgi:hypothetical protein
MRSKLIVLSVSLALLAAWAGGFFPSSWPDGHY